MATSAAEFWTNWAKSLEVLVSYRYLGCSSRAVDRHSAVGRMRLRSDMRTPAGLLTAPLGIALLDCAGINIDPIAQMAVTRIDVDVLEPATDVAAVRLHGRVVREGRTQMFTEARIEADDEPGRVIAYGSTSWAVGPRHPEGFRYADPGPGVAESPSLPPLWRAFDATRTQRGYEIEGLSPRVGLGRLHHGPMQVTLEAAANETALAALGSDDLRVEHTGLTIVRPGVKGPFVATADVMARRPNSIVCRAELIDTGMEGKLVATGSYRYRPNS